MTIKCLGRASLASALALLACQPAELGHVCDDDPELMDSLFEREPPRGENAIVVDVRFDHCDSARLCLQQDGAEPFCTRRCASDADCSDAPGFACAQAIAFGREGCRDFASNPDCIDDDGSLSDQAIRHCVRVDR